MAIEDTFTSTSSRTTDPYPVYNGIWTNWSRGKVMGATLTLNRQDADLLIAFTAFFIAFIGMRTWAILCFSFHRLFSTSSPQGIVYHQRQAILRNSSSPENGAYLFLQLLWAKRHLKQSLRVLPIIVTAVVCMTTFVLGGGFSSRISTGVGNEVLIRSENCGSAQPALFMEDADSFYAFQPYPAEKVMDAANYAQRCYTDNAQSDCSRFVKPSIQSKQDLNASCPFDESMCRSKSGNIRIDSGFIDSHEHLGLNSPPGQRIRWRHVVHCAPMVTEGFTSQENNSEAFTRYHYGNRTLSNGTQDYIYKVASVESQYLQSLSEDFATSRTTYSIHSLRVALKKNTTDMANSDFEPITALTRHDADTTFILLSGNGVVFTNSVPDDWYRVSSTPVDMPTGNINGIIQRQVYLPSEPASPLGCAVQYQFCNSALGDSGCGPLSSLRDSIAGAAPFFDTDYPELSARWTNGTARAETAGLSYLIWVFFGFNKSIHEVFMKLASTALLSQRTLISSTQGPLVPDQWKQDITNAWNISLALMQGSMIDAAYGPRDPDYLQSWVNYTSPSLKKLCSNQKILSASHGSFSLVGLYSILIAGLLITAVSYLLEPVSSYFCKKGRGQYAHLEWTTNTFLQLQRLAHEELGLGTWSQCADAIPNTKAAEVMACLDITDVKHPTLCPPEKHDRTGTDHMQKAPAKAHETTDSADSGKPPASEPVLEDIHDVTHLANLESQETQTTVVNHDTVDMDGQRVDKSNTWETEVGTDRMREQDGSALLVHNTNTTAETLPQSENGETTRR